MARRPAWSVDDNGRVICEYFDFKWNPGQSPTQKKKNIKALHESIGGKTLEISTKSDDGLGFGLSPFNFKIDGVPVETVYQASKVFENGVQYEDIMEMTPKAAKKDPRLQESGKVVGFRYKGEDFPKDPRSYFYNYIYYQGVRESFDAEELKPLLDYDHFTDIEFNPNKGYSTQARTVAMIKSLLERYGELPDMTPEEFLEFQKEALKCEVF